MEIETFNVYNAKAEYELDLAKLIEDNITQTERIIYYLNKIKPELVENYLLTLNRRLSNIIVKKEIHTHFEISNEVNEKLEFLKDNSLIKIITDFLFYFFDFPRNLDGNFNKVIVENLKHNKATNRLSYYRVKAFTDILNKEEGIRLYKDILDEIVDEQVKNSKYTRSSQKESAKKAIKRWTEIGLGNLVVCYFDDYKVLFRFDKCVIHESLKDLNDPDIAYIASCYQGDVQGAHPGKFFNMKRTQTLHHSDFCDELYWYNDVHKNPEMPSAEFTKNIGENKK